MTDLADPPLEPGHGGCSACGPLSSRDEAVQHAEETGHSVTWTQGVTYEGFLA